MKRKVELLPPETLTGIKVTSNKKYAAGLPAVTSSIVHLSKELGLFKGLKVMAKVNQKEGIDCPGCAWPDPEHRSKLGEYCENGAKAIAEEATDAKCDVEFFRRHSVRTLSKMSDYELGKSGRITQPMLLKKGSDFYEPISWESVYDKVGTYLKSIDPNDAVFYTSGRTSNETAFLYQLMVRKYGTNNLPDCSNMCHESSGVGLGRTQGIGKGSVRLSDLHESEVILVMGQNPGTNHPRMLSALQKCKQNGGKIVHINPLPEAGTTRFIDPQSPIEVLKGGTKIADHFLQVKINGDISLLKIIMHELIQRDNQAPGSVLDHEFIQTKTSGWDAFLSLFENFNKEQALKDCGVSMKMIQPVIELLAAKKKIIVCWAMGITQHRNGVANVQEIVNLLLMKGAIGKPGAGTCPVRGHSNVQGDRTMGIYEKPPKPFLDALEKTFQFSPPQEHGYDVVDSIHAMEQNKVKFFLSMGGNFISATPDSERTARAMQNCELTVQISTKLNRSHAITGTEALILPCLSRIEADHNNEGQLQFQSVENSMGVVHSTKGTFYPCSNMLRSEPEIVCGIATSLFPEEQSLWKSFADDYNKIRDKISETIPGFDDYNRKVRISGGFELPTVARSGDFIQGKAHFTLNESPEFDLEPDELIMMTIRSHDQYNTTIYGLHDRYRG
ncbi:MAG: FdhF/YdeP family oxidoreductase, partial [Bacteroidota bacterium]